jgi:hypothetical protein
VSLDGLQLTFSQGHLAWRAEGFMSSWDGILRGVSPNDPDLSDGEKRLVGETLDGRRVEGRVLVQSRALLSATLELQGTGELSVNGEAVRP